MDADTSSVTYAAPQDSGSAEQGLRLSLEEDTAKPVVSVAIFPRNTNFMMKICTCLLETDDDNTINLDLNVNTIFADWGSGRIQKKLMLGTSN